MSEVKSADEATRRAVEFAKRYKSLVIPLSAKREDGVWLVELDFGVFLVKKGQVRIDSSTGDIKDYEFPA